MFSTVSVRHGWLVTCNGVNKIWLWLRGQVSEPGRPEESGISLFSSSHQTSKGEEKGGGVPRN